ncbi:kanadaptin-like [Macrosteles quadrilineatus]|uniref:kanadaptin-like n=1 Tax=Macrosteles quadrilineatus TaxID=74068 RepID=UPI0023E22571|nr:kanadaptin-like [Macrosteles quadrilineatus]
MEETNIEDSVQSDPVEVSGDKSTENVSNEPFKKPQLIIGPQRGKNVTGKNRICRGIEEPGPIKQTQSEIEENDHKEKQSDENSSLKPNKDQTSNKPPSKIPPLPYIEPEWGGLPSREYKLEELKNGTIVKTLDLTLRSFHVFGRLENCDIPMLHPTVSRYHAVLQYRAVADEENDIGFYIYDLGSSLGTFHNKQKVKPKIFVRVKVGHMVKIGCSTRMFILQGPEEDEEPESELSVTELRQQHKERLAALEAEKLRLEAAEEERLKMEEEKGIDWGMGEDADEETDLTENPYASTLNEDLYLEDPKKTLRGWFEREGEELVYDVEEKGFGHYICRIELPVDNGGGGNLVAEASVKGKKKEAVIQAALEACRLLDRQGLLRQSTHESKKRAAKDWEAVDFYDSDEDNFLDRTGQIEKKRQKRMAQTGKLETEVETYDTLREKYEKLVKELENTEHRLSDMLNMATHSEAGRGSGETDDELDNYMKNLSQTPADKIQIKKTKDEVARLRVEEGRLRKLVNLAKPTELPKLEPFVVKPSKEKKKELPQGSIGKRLVKKRRGPQMALPLETTRQSMNEAEEEFEEDEEEEITEKKVGGKVRIEDETIQPEQEDPVDEVEIKKKKNRPDNRNRHKRKHQPPQKVDEEDYSNCTWTPPVGQTGDGRTSLNDKLGY